MTKHEHYRKYVDKAFADGCSVNRGVARSMLNELERLEAKNKALVNALYDLVDSQNGPPQPLAKYEASWNEAMVVACTVLKDNGKAY